MSAMGVVYGIKLSRPSMAHVRPEQDHCSEYSRLWQ
jgi:hypothetical protein